MEEVVSKYENFLGIDWGASCVGVSFSDAETRIAFALTTLKNDRTLIDRLGALIEEKEVGTVVIGIPVRNVSRSDPGRPSHVNHLDVSVEAGRFGETMKKSFAVRVAFQDEMFTTRMAEANLKERGTKHIANFDDTEAARIILQEWLDRRGDPALQP